MGTGFRKGGYLRCPPLLHAILVRPPLFLQHMKAKRGHAGLIPAADMNFWSMAGASEGPFPTLLLSPASLPLMAPPSPLRPFPLTLKLGQLQMSMMLV